MTHPATRLFFSLRALALGLLALVASAAPTQRAAAQQIDLSLNLTYSNPANVNSGGAWQVVATADNFGLSLLGFGLTGINPGISTGLPVGTVNGATGLNAGFDLFEAAPITGGFQIAATQITSSITGPGDEEGVFYGVGTLANGSPNFDGQPMGTNSIGPELMSLTNLSGVPWANGVAFDDPAFETAVIVASGTFAATQTPEFFGPSVGNVFTSLGTNTTFGAQADPLAVAINTMVRTNLVGLPDYNENGVVDAEDYTVWRDTLGDTVTAGTGADGDGNGVIEIADYVLWRDNFGAIAASSAAASAASIPEPSSGAIAALALASAAGFRPRKQGLSGSQPVFWKKREYLQKLLDTQRARSHNAAS